MGWKTFCCVQPKVPDQRETPRQIPATSFHKTGDSQFQAAQTPGGRTLLVTAQSGSAQDFEGHLRPSPKVPSQLPVPCKARTSKDTEADGVTTCNGPCSVGEEQQPAARSDSCPVGKQRPPGSLLEASQRRRRNVAARLPARHGAGLTQGTGLDDQQLTTIMRFMSVYQGQLEGTGFQLEEEMSPLLCNGLILRAHDGKVYTGKAAALRRLQHGKYTLTTRDPLMEQHPACIGFHAHRGCLHHLTICMWISQQQRLTISICDFYEGFQAVVSCNHAHLTSSAMALDDFQSPLNFTLEDPKSTMENAHFHELEYM